MNVNVWNIKDLFSTPTVIGPNKPPSGTSVPSDYNSMSDSQFLFGSQFCLENSQSASASLESGIQRQGKSSQQNSQDNEPSIFAKYQSKPQLFGGDGKEKGSLNFPPGRFKGVLEQFEENKKKFQEKHDSEILNTFILDTKESLQRLQSSLDKFEETLKSILNGLKNISKTMQETSESYYGAVLNALRDKHEMEQTLLMMEKRLGDKDTEIPDLKSSLQLLKESLEQLRAQQNEQHLKLCEQLGLLQLPGLLAELQAFISAPRITSHVKDNVSQTSPDMLLAQLPYNSHQSVLNASPGSKDISTAVASQGKENVSIQQRSHILATGHDVINALCTCCSGTAVPAVSHEGCWLLIQEPSETTPSRKVIKRDKQEKGLNAMRHSQHYQPDIDNVPLQNHVDGHKKLATDKKMQSGSIGIKTKREKPKKCNQRKRLGSSRKEGNFSKSTNAGVKPTITRKGCSRSKKAEHPYRGTRDPDNSSLGPPVVCQSKKCQAPHRKAEKSKVVLQSHENIQHVPNLQGMSGVKKKVDLSCTKNNYFWACSSPESSLSPDQVKWFILSNNSLPTCATPAQQKTTKCCPLFFDSDYSD